MRAVVYTRISNDRAEDDERVAPTTRQLEQCTRMAEAQGLGFPGRWAALAKDLERLLARPC